MNTFGFLNLKQNVSRLRLRCNFQHDCWFMVLARPADTLTRSSTNIPALYKLFIELGKSGDPGCLETLAEHDKGRDRVTVVGDQFVNSP